MKPIVTKIDTSNHDIAEDFIAELLWLSNKDCRCGWSPALTGTVLEIKLVIQSRCAFTQ